MCVRRNKHNLMNSRQPRFLFIEGIVLSNGFIKTGLMVARGILRSQNRKILCASSKTGVDFLDHVGEVTIHQYAIAYLSLRFALVVLSSVYLILMPLTVMLQNCRFHRSLYFIPGIELALHSNTGEIALRCDDKPVKITKDTSKLVEEN